MPSHSVGWALTWEYWRRGMYWFVAANIGLALGFTLLAYSTLISRLGLNYAALRTELDHGMIAFVLWPPIVISLAGWASLRRQYVLPVSTYRLVAWSLANGVAATTLIYGTMRLAMVVIYGADWPLWEPVLCTVTFYLFLQAVVWWSGSSQVLAVIALWIAFMLGASLGIEWVLQPLLDAKEPGTASLPPVTIVAMWGIAAVSYGLAVNGVARDRRGDAWSLSFVARLWETVGSATARASKRTAAARAAQWSFRSPYAAQLWAEWRAKGRICVATVALAVVGLGIGLALSRATPADASGGLAAVTSVLVMVFPFFGVYLGSDSGGFDRKTFSATRPLTDRSIAAAVLKNVTLVVVLSALIWIVSALTIAAIWQTQEWRELEKEWHRGMWGLVEMHGGMGIFVLYVWTVSALGASLAMARSWFVACAGLILLVLVAGFVRSLAFSAWPLPVLAVVCLVAVVAAFIAAYDRQLISNSALIASLAAYLVTVVGIFLSAHLSSPQNPMPFDLQICVIGFSSPTVRSLRRCPAGSVVESPSISG